MGNAMVDRQVQADEGLYAPNGRSSMAPVSWAFGAAACSGPSTLAASPGMAKHESPYYLMAPGPAPATGIPRSDIDSAPARADAGAGRRGRHPTTQRPGRLRSRHHGR